MTAHALDVTSRLGTDFQARELIRLIEIIREEMGFDDETRYDLVLEYGDGRRGEYEIRAAELSWHLASADWPQLHQLLFSNHWIKDMNVKVSLVKRPGGVTLSVKGEIDRQDAVHRLTEAIRQRVWAQTRACADALQERERLFGAMLLAKSVSDRTRASFLQGDFLGTLRGAYDTLAELQRRLLAVNPQRLRDLEARLAQDPPRILLPDRSGLRLRLELNALARLMSGTGLLLTPILSGKEPSPADTAVVLKYLVLISLLVERLEAATANPAAKRRKAASKRKRSQVRPAVKKRAARASGTTRARRSKAAARPRPAARKRKA